MDDRRRVAGPGLGYRGGIALLSPSGWGNLGDAGIVDSAVHAIRRRVPGAPLLGLTLNPLDTAERHGIAAFACSGFACGDYAVAGGATYAEPHAEPSTTLEPDVAPPREASPEKKWSGLKAAAKAVPAIKGTWRLARSVGGDLRHRRLVATGIGPLATIVVAGGGQLDDFWGGAFGHPYVLWRWARHARRAGSRFVVLSVGTGTLATPASRLFVRQALAMADYRSFRDVGSRHLVNDDRVNGDPVVPDLAYGLPVELYDRPTPRDGPRPLVGVSPIAHCDPRVWPTRDANRYTSYIGRLAVFALKLIDSGCDLVLYATDRPDELCIEDLRAEMGRRTRSPLDGRVTAPTVRTLKQLYATLAPLRVTVASRLHGVLLPHLVGLPVAALSYERKVTTLMRTMGHERYCLDIDEFDPTDAFSRVRDLLTDRGSVSSRIVELVGEYRRSVDAQYDHVFGRPVA